VSEREEVSSVKDSLSPRLVVLDDPRSFGAEAYRVLRNNLHYANPDVPLRRVLVTSAAPGEGKSTTAANLAVAMAQSERSVLLVEGDLRRPSVHTIFRQPNSPGLSSYLVGDSLLAAVLLKSAVPNLSLVVSGPIPPNPAELLASRRMRDFLDTVSERFDFVILDSPPALATSEACALAPHVDGVLLVVDSGRTPEVAVRRTRERLEAVHGRILGAILNRFDAAAHGYSRRQYDTYDTYYTQSAQASAKRRSGEARSK
jgi:capsular exopolysaccharide synthesis family protein